MMFVELLNGALVSVLVAYLSFTNALANMVISIVHETRPGVTETISISTISNSVSQPSASAELRELSSRLAHAIENTVPRVLLENTDFQQAALGAADLTENFSPRSEVPVRERIESALVNVFCQYKTEHYIRTTTGTGIFIDPKGVILTNAHVAQFLLLKDSDSKVIDAGCIIRVGNPATPTYRAELLYISPMWIYQNASLITEESPRGTGERDYALLYVSDAVNKNSIPESFPFLSVDTELLTIYTKGIGAITAGYPAEILQREGARAKLVPVVASTTIEDLFTFGSNYADVMTISESPVGEQGASGGPIARDDGSVIGLIVTKGDQTSDGSHSLRAITLSYIDRTIEEETGYRLAQNMRGDLAYRSGVFKKALVPFLANLLATEISHSE